MCFRSWLHFTSIFLKFHPMKTPLIQEAAAIMNT